jgi:hypothetical protein
MCARCAVYLSDLCHTAIAMHARYGHYPPLPSLDPQSSGEGGQSGPEAFPSLPTARGGQPDRSLPRTRGFIVDYDSLPGIFPRLLMTFLGVSVSDERFQQLIAVSSQYSKGRAWYYPKAGHFSTDSTDKKARATDAIRKWSSHLLDPSYQQLAALATESYLALTAGSLANENTPQLALSEDTRVIEDWSPLKAMPTEQAPDSSPPLFTSDSNFDAKLYNPFSTSFNSSYFEVSTSSDVLQITMG